jgi:hypothetical protein
MRPFSVFCACVALTFSTSAWAAKFHLDAQVVEAFSADGLFTPIPLPDYTKPVGYPAVYKIDYSIVANTAEFAPTDLGFGFLAFSVDLSQGVTDAFRLGWNPHNPTVDTNGNLPGGEAPLFFDNMDAGISGSDLYAIIVSSGPPVLINWPSDPRSQVALSGPQLIGSTYLLWNGVNPAVSALGTMYVSSKNRVLAQTGVVELSVRGVDGFYLTSAPATTIYFGTSSVLANPEPTSAVLMLGFAATALFRRSIR